MKYAILTFGCRVNQADSFEFEEGLRLRGAVEAPPASADLVIVNTCSVTGSADQGARRTIRGIARDNPSARILVTGCYATRRPDDLVSLPNVVALVPNQEKDGLLRVLEEEFALTTAVRFGDGDAGCGAAMGPGAMGRTAIPLRVQTGCDETCAFCIIPSTRGHSRSRPLLELGGEAERLAASGYKEVWLVGVHLGSYGRDIHPASSLLELLRLLDRVPGDVTFRISSLEPMDCAPALIELVGRSGRFAPHFHLPLQHGSDRMLRAMRRPYAFASYRELVGGIAGRVPGASIGTDMIVGFPGETDEDAEIALRGIDALPLSYLHVFPYSDRPGTAASAMTPKIPPPDIQRRARRLRDAGRRAAERFVASRWALCAMD